MTLGASMQALCDLVEADRRACVEGLIAEARTRRAALLAAANAEARMRMREAFREERARASQRIAAARAELATRQRLHEQQHATTMLAAGLARLPDAIREQWRDHAGRARWIDALVAAALPVLPRTAWRIAHPVDWPEAERQALAARLQQAVGTAPLYAPEVSIDAGIRCSAGGNVIDGTLAGLTTDRTSIGAQLLGLLEDAR